MRKLALTGLVAVLACGGGNGGNNNNNNTNTGTPGLKTFSYGSPQTPTNAQKNTANSAQTQLNNAVKASVNGQAVNALSLPQMTDSLAGSLPNLIALPDDPTTSELFSAVLGHRGGALSTGCTTVTPTTVTYSNCTLSGSGFNYTYNGTLTINGSNVTWNMTANYSQSVQGYSATGTYAWTGQLTISGGTIVGQGRSMFNGHGSEGSVTFDYQYTSGFDANLGYQTSPSYCLSSGTLEIRRTLNETTNAGAVPVHDAGAKYTWTGCGAVGVSPGN